MFAVLLASVSSGLIKSHQEKSFVAHLREHNLVYTGDEYQFRLGLYLSNARLVREHNAKSTFRVALNRFATLTQSEYKALLGFRRLSPSANRVRPSAGRRADPPDSYDYRDQGAVNGIKDQGQCGSCWGFSAIAAQESQWAIQNGQLLNLSEQNLVDCVTSCYGCDGGDKALAYDYVISSQGGSFNSEVDYPYTANDGSCRYKPSAPISKVTGYIKTTANNEDSLLNGIYANGPAGVSIDASQNSFQLYSTGVYNEPRCSSSTHDHAVLAVGWGVDGTTPFWIIKNSWGPAWGEKGYIRMSRNKNNQCCIACAGVIPTVK
jgi:cathepsin L